MELWSTRTQFSPKWLKKVQFQLLPNKDHTLSVASTGSELLFHQFLSPTSEESSFCSGAKSPWDCPFAWSLFSRSMTWASPWSLLFVFSSPASNSPKDLLPGCTLLRLLSIPLSASVSWLYSCPSLKKPSQWNSWCTTGLLKACSSSLVELRLRVPSSFKSTLKKPKVCQTKRRNSFILHKSSSMRMLRQRLRCKTSIRSTLMR